MRDKHRRNRYSGRSLSGAPLWIKVTVWVGVLLAIAGFGVLGYGFVTTLDAFTSAFPAAIEPGRFTPPSFEGLNLGLGFGLFFAGFVVSAVGALANETRH